MQRQFFNDPIDAVTEGILGVCSSSRLKYLDGLPEIKVLVSEDLEVDKVSVISGGGSGHEPAHGGYVGNGMLAAAVVGDVFASPPAEAILACLKAVTGAAGTLMVIMNYTGDRLNFGLALEQARVLGLKVEMVVVGDDCALPGKGPAGRRGIAGTVLVNKVAGAAAAAGLSLEEVRQEAEQAAGAVGSMGVASRACSTPGEEPTRSIEEGMVEMGLGIHGEPGAYKRCLTDANSLVSEVTDKILGYKDPPEDRGCGCAVLVNNLGTTSCMEMGCLLNAVAGNLAEDRGLHISRMYCGTFMTATDMAGFSISVMWLTPQRMQLLDAPAQAHAWPDKPAEFQKESQALAFERQSHSFTRPEHLSKFGRLAEACLGRGAEGIIEAAPQLDEWDKRVGDGDCGSTVRRGAHAIQDSLGSMPLNDARDLCQSLAHCCSTMGGTSGALYNIFFTAAAANLPESGGANLRAVGKAFSDGASKIITYGGAQEGSRTMLDALLPAASALSEASSSGKSAEEAVRLAAAAAKAGAENTKKMTAGAGRSSYIPGEEIQGIPDPGAMAVSIWLDAISDSFS